VLDTHASISEARSSACAKTAARLPRRGRHYRFPRALDGEPRAVPNEGGRSPNRARPDPIPAFAERLIAGGVIDEASGQRMDADALPA